MSPSAVAGNTDELRSPGTIATGFVVYENNTEEAQILFRSSKNLERALSILVGVLLMFSIYSERN